MFCFHWPSRVSCLDSSPLCCRSESAHCFLSFYLCTYGSQLITLLHSTVLPMHTLSVYMPVQTVNTVMCLLFNEHTGEVDLWVDSSVRKKQDWEHSSLEERKCFIEEIITVVAAVPSSTVMYVPENKNATGHMCVLNYFLQKACLLCDAFCSLSLSLHTTPPPPHWHLLAEDDLEQTPPQFSHALFYTSST